jgi:CRP-like cAMP-binding protein
MQFRNQFLAHLDAAQLAAMTPHLTSIRLTTGQVLYESGDPAHVIYFPNSTVVSVVTLMMDGRAVEASTLGYESVVGIVVALSGAPSHARIFAQIAGSAMKMQTSDLREQLTNDPGLLKLLMRHVQNDMAQAEQTAACNALHLAHQRLARWLLLTDDRVDGTVVHLTQDYLAMMLGVQRTTVSTMAHEFKAAGLIDYRRGRIEILDRAGLERVSCECYEVGRLRRLAHTRSPNTAGVG